MLSWLFEHAERSASTRRCMVVLVLLVVTLGLVNLANLPFTGPRLVQVTNGQALLDLRLFYNADEAMRVISAYGTLGRHTSLGFYGTWDLVIPPLTFIFSALSLSLLWGREPWWRWLLLPPVAAITFDLLENLLLAALMLSFPASHRWVASTAGVFTFVKWLAYGSSVALVLVGFVKGLVIGGKR